MGEGSKNHLIMKGVRQMDPKTLVSIRERLHNLPRNKTNTAWSISEKIHL